MDEVPSLQPCWAKVERASESLAVLQHEIGAFIAAGPFSLVQEADANPLNRRWRVESVAPVPYRFRVLVGEIIHHLRSSFDLLVYQLIVKNTGRDPKFRSEFPVFTTRSQDYKAKVASRIRGVSECAAERIESLQPCEGSAGAFIRTLHELDIIDKHRLLVAVIGNAHLTDVSFRDKNTGRTLAMGEVFIPLKPGAVLITSRSTPPPFDGGEVPEMFMRPDFRFAVTFGESTLADRPLVEELQQLREMTSYTLGLFREDFF